MLYIGIVTTLSRDAVTLFQHGYSSTLYWCEMLFSYCIFAHSQDSSTRSRHSTWTGSLLTSQTSQGIPGV